MNTTKQETVFFSNGDKAGVVVRENAEWVAYSTADLEVYRGQYFTEAAWSLRNGQ